MARPLSVAGVLVGALALILGLGTTSAGAATRPVVLVLVRDSDWSMMPTSIEGWATANLSLHSATNGEREMDSYLSIGKGGRTSGLGSAVGAGALDDAGGSIRLLDWARFEQHDRGLRFPGHLGELARMLDAHHIRSELVISTDSEVAGVLVNRDGVVPHASGGGSLGVATALARGVQLVVVETDYTAVPSVLRAAEPGCVLLASSSTPEHSVHLGALAISPTCGLGHGRLRSPTTRQTDFVVLGDLAPTTLHLLGADGGGRFEGSVLEPATGHRSLAHLILEDRRATVTRHAEVPFCALLLGGSLAALVLTATADHTRRRRAIATVLALPVSTLLIDLLPWWRLGVTAGVAACAGCAAGLGALAGKMTGWRPVRVVVALTAATMAVIGLDAATGGRLQLDSAVANNAIGAGRFTGMGNVPYGFFVAASIVLATLALARWGRRGLPAAGAIGAVAVVLDGAPMLGADVGGVLASVPAFAFLLAAWRRRLPMRRIAPLLATGVVVVAAFGAFDLSRPLASQTHLARALSGGGFGATAIRRELRALASFRSSPYRYLLTVCGLGLWFSRSALPSVRAVRVGLLALGIVALLGTFLNDSGVAVGGAVAAVAWPTYALLLEPDLMPARPPAAHREPRATSPRT